MQNNHAPPGRHAGFTIIELLVVIAIISLLISILLPSLAGARDQARYAKWAGYSHGLRTDQRMVSYYNFEQQGDGYLELWNRAAGNAMDFARDAIEPEDMNGTFGDMSGATVPFFAPAPGGQDGIVGNGDDPTTLPEWGPGRWKAKGALHFQGGTLPDVVQVPGDRNKLLRNMSDACTVAVWFSPNIRLTGTENVRIFEKGNQFFLLQQPGTEAMNWTLKTGENPSAAGWTPYTSVGTPHTINLTNPNDIQAGEWFLVVGTFDGRSPILPATGARLRYWANGKTQGTPINITGTLSKNDQPMWIGNDDNQFGSGLDGIMDEVMLFNEPLLSADGAGGINYSQLDEMYRVGRPRSTE